MSEVDVEIIQSVTANVETISVDAHAIFLTKITKDPAKSLSAVFTCILDTLRLDLVNSHSLEWMRSSEILDVIKGDSMLKVEIT